MALRVALIDHSFHKRTASSAFFRNIVSSAAEVDEFWDEEWRGGPPLDLEGILTRSYHRIIVFQAENLAVRIARLCSGKKVVFVPMWDSSGSFGRMFWTRDLAGVRMVCFSQNQAEQLSRWGALVKAVRYFPEPPKFESLNNEGKLRGFFWWRREEVPFRWVRRLCDPSAWDSIHVHLGPDPNHKLDEGELKDSEIPLTISRWSGDIGEYQAALRGADVVFASRLNEGIGMSVLEAMALGKAVVAVDRPTMNEYITPGVTGYLVSPAERRIQDFSRAREYGARAREAIERGRPQWLGDIDGLLQWMLGDHRAAAFSTKGQVLGTFPEAEVVIGHFDEWVDGRLEERRFWHPSVVGSHALNGDCLVLARVPLPEAVVFPRDGKAPEKMSAKEFARLLSRRSVLHLDQRVSRVADRGRTGRRRTACFQAQVLIALGGDMCQVNRALKERLIVLANEELDAALARRRVILRPWVWGTALRRLWPIVCFYGLRGGLRLGMARMSGIFRKRSARQPR